MKIIHYYDYCPLNFQDKVWICVLDPGVKKYIHKTCDQMLHVLGKCLITASHLSGIIPALRAINALIF